MTALNLLKREIRYALKLYFLPIRIEREMKRTWEEAQVVFEATCRAFDSCQYDLWQAHKKRYRILVRKYFRLRRILL